MTDPEVIELARQVYGRTRGTHEDRLIVVMQALSTAGQDRLRFEDHDGRTVLARWWRQGDGGSVPLCELPPAAGDQEPRWIQLRLSQDQYIALQVQADNARLPVSDYLRKLVVEQLA
jgi:hypothetical protein